MTRFGISKAALLLLTNHAGFYAEQMFKEYKVCSDFYLNALVAHTFDRFLFLEMVQRFLFLGFQK